MGICKSCGGNVDWKKDSGRWQCFNAGTEVDHWDSCSARRWKQTVATGTRFENERQRNGDMFSGYEKSIHGTRLDHIEKPMIFGKKYKPDGCDCGLPPWELCRSDCAHALYPTPDVEAEIDEAANSHLRSI